ncbi:MAG: hypothetical protein ISN28_02065 [Ectothiorhodospiraceae bacterium AqS1]|nr:hypothetical protein [Ectothiorhodospiraceae bacterium AqS1]
MTGKIIQQIIQRETMNAMEDPEETSRPRYVSVFSSDFSNEAAADPSRILAQIIGKGASR